MGKFIEEFFYGNIDPQARSTKQGLCVPKSQSKATDFLAALFFEG